MFRKIQYSLGVILESITSAWDCAVIACRLIKIAWRIPRTHAESVKGNLNEYLKSPWILDDFKSSGGDAFQKKDQLSASILKSFFEKSGIAAMGKIGHQASTEHSRRITEYFDVFFDYSGIGKIPDSDSLPNFSRIEQAREYLETFYRHSNISNICSEQDPNRQNLAAKGIRYFKYFSELPELFSFSRELEQAITEKERSRLVRNIHDYALSQIYGGRIVFGQEAEDLLVSRLFPADFIGYYLDIGAYHPVRFSNTYLLHKRGWKGVNVEPLREGIENFKRFRPADTNVQTLVNTTGEASVYYMFDEPALNTLDLKRKEHLEKNTSYRSIGKEEIPAMTIMELAEKHLDPTRQVDVMNIDIENMEYDVLSKIDFNRLKPKVILVENRFFETDEKDSLDQLLCPEGYRNIASTTKTRIYAQNEIASRARL